MRNIKKFCVVFFSLFLFAFSVVPTSIHATESYSTDSYTMNAVIDEDHVIHIEETFEIDFGSTYRHGIYRYIPFEQGVYSVSNVDTGNVAVEQTTEYDDGNDYVLLRLGDEDRTVTGNQTYTISYDLVCYEDDDTSADWLSLDLMPSDWETSIGEVNATVELPKSISWDDLKVYGGEYGSTSTTLPENYELTIDEDNNTISLSALNVEQGYSATIRAELPEGYWVDPANRDFIWIFVYISLFSITLLIAFLWYKFGRDPEMIQTVEFYPPEDLSPAEIGYIIDGEVNEKDISAMYLYYADKGYLSIHEYQKNKFELKKEKDMKKMTPDFIQYLFKETFKGKDTVKLDSMPKSYGDSLLKTKEKIESYFSQHDNALYAASSRNAQIGSVALLFVQIALVYGLVSFATFETYFIFAIPIFSLLIALGLFIIMHFFDRKETNSKAKTTTLIIIGSIIVMVGAILYALLLSSFADNIVITTLAFISVLVNVVFIVLMKARTKEQSELMGKILGFKNFIKTAEYDRLKVLSDENPSYFFDILPYAYIFGMDTEWVKRFDQIHIPQPSWCSTYSPTPMNYMWYHHMLHSYHSNVSQQYHDAITRNIEAHSHTSSSGGGFSGGGFSGGGFGGGGGGAW